MLFKSLQIFLAVTVSTCLSWSLQEGQEDSKPEPAWATKRIENILGYESCRKCHLQQIETLTQTAHFRSFETLHRTAEAKAYCKQLGMRSVKRSERCVRCHYTPAETSRGVKAQSGISCESCHGPAENWIKGHNDYGGITKTRETETVEHRAFRIENSIDLGMRHPSNVYLLAKSCYDCHLVNDEELVNKTPHSITSPDFNLVAWSQGSMRHNYLRSDGVENAKSSPERLRVMYVTDLITRIEYLLKAMVKSQPGQRHHQALKADLSQTYAKLQAVRAKVKNAWVDGATKAIATLPDQPDGNFQTQLARYLGQLAFDFAKNESVHKLDGIQDLLPPPSSYR